MRTKSVLEPRFSGLKTTITLLSSDRLNCHSSLLFKAGRTLHEKKLREVCEMGWAFVDLNSKFANQSWAHEQISFIVILLVRELCFI